VLIGYSKGAADILEAVVAYPEIRSRVAAVVSAAGAVGGSPCQRRRAIPGGHAAALSGRGLPLGRRRRCAKRAARHAQGVDGQPSASARSALLLARDLSAARAHFVDPRIELRKALTSRRPQRQPGDLLRSGCARSVLMGYVNADHWALAVPVARTHTTIASLFVAQNAYSREALTEAILRFVEEDMAAPGM